jgi:DNA polymerase (family 10)
MRAAAKIRTLSESVDELVRDDADLTAFAGIGEAIASALREIVMTDTLGKLERLRSEASPELASINGFPRLDPKRVLRIYKKLNIRSVEELRGKLKSGQIEKHLGLRMAQHVRQGVTEAHAMLLYRAHDLRIAVEEFLLEKCGVHRAEAVALIGAGWTSLRNWPSSSRRTILRPWCPGWGAMADAPHC